MKLSCYNNCNQSMLKLLQAPSYIMEGFSCTLASRCLSVTPGRGHLRSSEQNLSEEDQPKHWRCIKSGQQ